MCYNVIKGTQCSVLNTVIVNNEQYVVGTATHCAVTEATHTTVGGQTQTNKGDRCVTCVLAELRAHYTPAAIPKQKRNKQKKKSEEEKRGGGESSVRRWRRSSR